MANVSFIDIFDPRGRADRRGLAIAAIVLLIAQTFAFAAMTALETDLNSGHAYVIHSLFAGVALVAVVKRMHDFGRGAGIVAAAFGALVVWSFALTAAVITVLGEDSFMPGGPALPISLTGMALPVLAAALWLHVKKGHVGDNRFGPAPGPSGFSHPHPNLLASRLNPSIMSS